MTPDNASASASEQAARPAVSVVIPCYNAEKWVARAIRSALGQPGVEAEVIVIDDGSTDGSLEVIRGFGDRIRHESGLNHGACAARNRGLELATADYAMFMDADDYLEGRFLSGLAERLRDTGADLAVGPCADASETRYPCPRQGPRTDSAEHLIMDWLTGRWVAPCALLWRRERVLQLGGWRTDLQKNQDGELVLRAAIRGVTTTKSDAGCAVYWHHQSPVRITNIVSEEKFESVMKVFRMLVSELEFDRSTHPKMWDAASAATHASERAAVIRGLGNSAKGLREFRRSLGFKRYHGSPTHIFGSWLLGLRRKERLSRWLHAQRRRFWASGS